MVNETPAIIDEGYLSELQKKAGEKKIINKFRKKTSERKGPTTYKINADDLFEASTKGVNLETQEETKQDEKMVKENNKEFNESLFYGGSAVETPKIEENEPEEIVYKCSCGGEITRGQIFCHKCGSALDIDWNRI